MDVQITVTSTATVDGDTDRNEFTVAGTLIRLGDEAKLRYREPGEGMEGVITTLSVRGNEVRMSRAGGASLLFISGKRTESDYPTPYGVLKLGVAASLVRADVAGTVGSIRLKYHLDVDGRPTSDIVCHVTYQETEQKGR